MKLSNFLKLIIFFFGFFLSGLSYASNQNECDTTVWFVNFYPGEEIYELEGHSALRIKTCDKDVAITYGMFSFDEPNFVYRFVKGETDYMVAEVPWGYFISEYLRDNRRIVAHKLNLNSKEKSTLFNLIEENLQPENRVYRYNYVLDNCATRPLRLVERAIGDTLCVADPSNQPNLTTFRNYMRFYHRNYPWYQFGIDLALGTGIDREITSREKTFAPIVLDSQLDNIRISGSGSPKLVEETTVINNTPADGAIDEPTPWYLTPIFVCWFFTVIVSLHVIRMVYIKKRFPRAVVTVVYGLNGIAGLVVAFLVFISVHEATSPNYNLLWLNPLCFIPAISIWIKNAKKLNYWYFLCNFVLLLALIVVWVTEIQSPNPAFVPLVLLSMLIAALYVYMNNKSSENSKISK